MLRSRPAIYIESFNMPGPWGALHIARLNVSWQWLQYHHTTIFSTGLSNIYRTNNTLVYVQSNNECCRCIVMMWALYILLQSIYLRISKQCILTVGAMPVYCDNTIVSSTFKRFVSSTFDNPYWATFSTLLSIVEGKVYFEYRWRRVKTLPNTNWTWQHVDDRPRTHI